MLKRRKNIPLGRRGRSTTSACGPSTRRARASRSRLSAPSRPRTPGVSPHQGNPQKNIVLHFLGEGLSHLLSRAADNVSVRNLCQCRFAGSAKIYSAMFFFSAKEYFHYETRHDNSKTNFPSQTRLGSRACRRSWTGRRSTWTSSGSRPRATAAPRSPATSSRPRTPPPRSGRRWSSRT